jgi:hypothetical protein
MTTRERNLAVAVSAVLGVSVVGFLGCRMVLFPLMDKDKQITQKQVENSQLLNDIDDIQIAKRKFEALRQQSLPADPGQGVGVARSDYGNLLEHMCRRADLIGLKITAGEPDNKSVPMLAAKKPAFTKLSWDVTAKGDEYHLIDFLRLFYSQPLLHTIKSMTLQRPSDNRSQSTRELDINLKIEALVLDNAPARPSLLPVERSIALLSGLAAYTGINLGAAQSGRSAPIPPTGVLADPPREYLTIAGKNVFFGPPPVGPKPPPSLDEDLSRFIVVTSIVGHDDGSVEAMLRDQLNNYDYTITQSAKGVVGVKGEWEINGKKKVIPGYSDKSPGQTLFYGSEKAKNYRAWRVRRLTANEVVLEMADRSERYDEDEERPKPPGLAFVGGAVGAFLDVPEGKMYSVGAGQCLETQAPEDEEKPPLHPLATKLLRREAFKLIYTPIPESPPINSLVEDRQR